MRGESPGVTVVEKRSTLEERVGWVWRLVKKTELPSVGVSGAARPRTPCQGESPEVDTNRGP